MPRLSDRPGGLGTAPRADEAPHLSYVALGLRFLRFGLLAWGGPVAQIAMLRRSLVDEEGWISSDRFNRTLAVYQVLPGPEAQELCVYFGTLSRGRLGGLLAGLGFMLPGFVMMLALAWVYTEVGMTDPALAAAFAGAQAAVLALIIRGVHRIGSRALHGRWLPVIALTTFVASAAGLHFAVPLGAGGIAYALASRGRRVLAAAVLVALVAAATGAFAIDDERVGASGGEETLEVGASPDPPELFVTGLQAGALSFGGAYTAIPFVQADAVGEDGWMTNRQFLDGLALSGTIPAPLVIFGTFVGYVGAGVPGAVALTVGMFLPAFALTLAGHRHLEAAVEDERLHAALDGITAGVVGLVALTAVQLAVTTLTGPTVLVIFGLAAVALYAWQAGLAIPAVVIGAALLGIVAGRG